MVWGHSQGGHAALWTEPVAADYAPQLRILGTAALSPLTDPLAMARELTERDASAELSIMAAWVLVPYADLYPDVNVEDYVATSGRAIVREMTQRCLSEPGLFVSAITSLGVSADRPLYPANLSGRAARAAPRAERRERTVAVAAAHRVVDAGRGHPARAAAALRRRPVRGGGRRAVGAVSAR